MNSPAIVSGTNVVGSNLAQPPAEIRLPQLTMQACALAKQSVAHAIDGLINGSQASLQGVRTCEEKLDDLDRELDEHMAETITRVTPAQARELLACMKLMLDLERVGDLIASFAERSAIVRNRIDMEDVEQLTRMACMLENMLAQIAQAFEQRNVDQALHVLRSDAEIDRLRNLLLVRHTEHNQGLKIGQESLHVLSMANALERAGDHIKNMAEELCHLATGHTIRHLLRSKDKPVEQLFLDWLAKREQPRK
jgi:phosphate transport system protein